MPNPNLKRDEIRGRDTDREVAKFFAGDDGGEVPGDDRPDEEVEVPPPDESIAVKIEFK